MCDRLGHVRCGKMGNRDDFRRLKMRPYVDAQGLALSPMSICVKPTSSRDRSILVSREERPKSKHCLCLSDWQ